RDRPAATDPLCQAMTFRPAGQVTQLSLNGIVFRQLPVSGHTVHKQTTGKRFARQNMHAPQTEIIPVVISAAMPPPELSSHAPPGIAGSRLTEPYIQSALVQAEVVISTMTVPCHGPCTPVCIAVVHHLCPAVCTVAENELTGGKHGTRFLQKRGVILSLKQRTAIHCRARTLCRRIRDRRHTAAVIPFRHDTICPSSPCITCICHIITDICCR